MGTLKIGVHGASGRMGQEILAVINYTPAKYSLAFSKVSKNDAQDSSNYRVDFPAQSSAEVVIDFSVPEATLELLEWCKKQKIALVIGTTGFNSGQLQLIEDAAKEIPIVMSPNMSLSVNVLFNLVNQVARSLSFAEVEVIESHHRYKKDAPSGTALRLGEAVANARGQNLTDVACFSRSGTDNVRTPEEIGFAVVRGGDIVGKHTVSFICNGEELNLTSEITNRKSFAEGSLLAAQFVSKQLSGIYSMNDVLGLQD